MAGPDTRDPAEQWRNFTTRPTNGVTSSLSHSVTDIRVSWAGPAVEVQPIAISATKSSCTELK
uniref:Uncharacterized protein n=1 Tax=Anguilla anguilla TaxID=7936 RepID=A0A0E9QFQ2_ANGAN